MAAEEEVRLRCQQRLLGPRVVISRVSPDVSHIDLDTLAIPGEIFG